MPTHRPDVTIFPAARADRDRTAAVLAAAFATDPHTVAMLPPGDQDGRLRRMFTAMFDEAMAAGGDVHVAADAASGDLLGVGVWDAPGASVPTLASLRSVPAHVRVFGRRIVDAARSEHAAHLHRPQVPHWYLRLLGTTPAARGRGVAGALLADRFAAADAARVGCYLESSTQANVPFYERHGFVVRGEVPAYGTTPAIGMWRPPTGG
ncbi:GNAT family N-acetyltransferase [Nocardioides zeae]|uniref:GNAT family N-acetyltransferase n=1 Tax=Nocardioides imazamoxiresistens TaxID=3231893 RepID=A0ABU3PQT6_9ACTN|nr:GNAT family N-acetyltransferase [Nocardioides zeae]MDT9591551.1 GNAT family N-acetyltransferase [Nocardioides zeae]